MPDNLDERVKQLSDILQNLVDLYIQNKGTDREFVACITPLSARELKYRDRMKNKVWNAWDTAIIALEDKEWMQ